MASGSRPYVTTDVSTTPFQRSISLSPVTNHLYVISRTAANAGLTVNVLDANTGADLYRLKTNGIGPSGTIMLAFMAVADDGAVYASSISITNGVTIYRWADDNGATLPSIVFSGVVDPGAASNTRWGDSLAVSGQGPNTMLSLDAFNSTRTTLLRWSDSSMTSLVVTNYTHSYTNVSTGDTGKVLQFGPTNTYFLKKKTTPTFVSEPLKLLRYDTPPTVTELSSVNYYPQVGLVAMDLSKKLAAGIFFSTNASPTTAPADRLIVYDISNFSSPLQVAQYNFPTNHQANGNFIGQIVFGSDKIFAVEGNNGIIAVPQAPATVPSLRIALAGGSVVLSWTNTVPGFVLQSTPSLVPTTWNPVAQPVLENGNLNIVADTLGGGPQFYRLVK